MIKGETMKLRIGMAQINTTLGVVSRNLDKHMKLLERAISEGVDLLIFPELSLTGYVLQDLAHTVSLRPHLEDPMFKKLILASNNIDLVVGFVDEDQRHRFFIASAYISKGEVVHIHHKLYLPTYGLFDEGRFFAWGDTISAFDTRFGRIGILICEDFWHASPPYLLWLDGADIFLFTSASPGRGLNTEDRLESARWVEHLNQAYASLFTAFVVHVNRVGYEDGLNFWGGSTIFDPDGVLLCKAPYHKEKLVTFEIDLNELHRVRARLPLLRDERTALIQREMDRILKGGKQVNR